MRLYRDGGRGMENVLTADVLAALDMLPRSHFFSGVLRMATWEDRERLSGLCREIEESDVTIFPEAFALRPNADTHQERIEVQPDGRIQTRSHLVVIEAKRIKPSAFQPEQLARNALVLLRDCAERIPTLLLVLGREPPVNVAGHGRQGLDDAVELGLPKAYEKIDGLDLTIEQVRERIPRMLAWVTWQQIGEALQEAVGSYFNADKSSHASIQRIANQAISAVEWHKGD